MDILSPRPLSSDPPTRQTNAIREARMSNYQRVLSSSLLASGFLVAWAGPAQPAKPPVEVPRWLVVKMSEFEARPPAEVPIEIWRITYQGKPAFFFIAPCCDRLNPLFSVSGEKICSPSGGFTGAGDGNCPKPVDSGTQPTFIWAHHASPHRPRVPPRFGRE